MSISCHIRLGPPSEELLVDNISRPTLSLLQAAAGSTTCSSRLGPRLKELLGRLDILAKAVPGPS